MRVPLLILAGTSLLLVVLAAEYFFGRWIPNRPDAHKYPIRGLDVSAHQGPVNWNSVASSGIHFVYLKATEGGDFKDPSFIQNLRNANAAGIKCGAYHFFSLKSPGAIQAQNFINTVPSESMALPPAIDLEFTGNSSARPSSQDFNVQLSSFLTAIRKIYGREIVTYTSRDFADSYLRDYSIKRPWIRAVLFGPDHDEANSWTFWQFTERGTVPGINGYVDMDVFNGDPNQFHLLTTQK